jgi:sugar phosphate permease
VAYLIQLCGAGAAILLPHETVTQRKPLNEVGLRPRVGIPAAIRLQFISPAVTGFATFSLIGFYSALIPSLLGETLHLSSPLIAGAIVCELFLIAAVAILTSGALASQAATIAALLLLPPSVWILVGAELNRSLALLFFAAALGGVAGGLGYRGSLEVINRIAPTERRSEVVSSYMIALFAGNSVPVIGIGFLAAATGALTAHVTFAAVLTVLAGVAMLTGIKYAPDR